MINPRHSAYDVAIDDESQRDFEGQKPLKSYSSMAGPRTEAKEKKRQYNQKWSDSRFEHHMGQAEIARERMTAATHPDTKRGESFHGAIQSAMASKFIRTPEQRARYRKSGISYSEVPGLGEK